MLEPRYTRPVRSIVVVPTYREAENIVDLLRSIRAAAPDTDVLVVDDDSPDGTGRLAEEVGAEIGGVEVLHRARKEGLGAAYRHGFRVALDGGYDVVAQMDAGGFGSCSNEGECEAVCPKQISIASIARMNGDFMRAATTK